MCATMEPNWGETRKLLVHIHSRLSEKADRRNKVDPACPPAEYCPHVAELAVAINAGDLADLHHPILAGHLQRRMEEFRDFGLQEVFRKFPRLVKRYKKHVQGN
jgi:hypothetical protein